MIQWPRLGLYGEFEPCEEGVLQAINENFSIIDTLLQMSIIDFVSELPEDPNPGDTYILEDDPYTYVSNDSVIVMYNGNEWVFIHPQAGFLAFDQSENKLMYYSNDQWNYIPESFGDVSGPSSSTDNAIARFDGTTGKWIQNSGVIIEDDDSVHGASSIYVDNLVLNGDSIYSDNGSIYADSDFYTKEKLAIENKLEFYQENDNSSGDNITLSARTKVITRLVNSSLNSIDTITYNGQGLVILSNLTADTISITELGNIITGVGGSLDLENNASLILYYDKVSNKYRVIGGTGSGGGGGSSVVTFINPNYEAPDEITGIVNYYNFNSPTQNLWVLVTLGADYKPGKQIRLLNAKLFVNSTDTSKLIRFYTEVFLFRDGSFDPTDLNSKIAYQDTPAVGSDVNVGSTTMTTISTFFSASTTDGKVDTTDVQPGDTILVCLSPKQDDGDPDTYIGEVNLVKDTFKLKIG